MPRSFPRGPERRGIAVLEFAICLPLLVLITLATVEACAMIYLKQSLKIAAYEGTRVGMVRGSKAENVQAQCDLLLASRNLQGYVVSMDPPDPRTLAPGDFFRVSVAAPCVPNSLIGGWFYHDQTLTESVHVMAE